MGTVARRGGFARALLGALLGMLIIHAGGVAQLAILTGDPGGGLPARLAAVPADGRS